ncbi:FliH/SctL family protein [Asticcacaulis sp. EMRT-3]|uniref:FliH/SctL family protein n=1 Tax=Asticcacaulis sp. EMRT-3 TaxID=3040349 RepID=UPI0024AEE99F|nr:FliH/SctL family protein [Asticcacaulis sp. EMRT-3]MDI7775487.1 FliH/SctL family protein [Asticcacaulis sp. EMRT-3]
MTEAVQHKRFDFGTVFDGGGKVVSAPKREKKAYTPEEVEAIRIQAYAEGEASALARAQMAQAAAQQQLADAAQAGLSHITQAVQNHKELAVKLALACAQKIAAEALDRFPQAPLDAALAALGQEIQPATRLVLFARDPDHDLKAAASDAAAMAGFMGQIQFRDNPALPKGAFEVVWPEGRADYDPQTVFATLERALAEALEAEAYHQSRAHGAPHQ